MTFLYAKCGEITSLVALLKHTSEEFLLRYYSIRVCVCIHVDIYVRYTLEICTIYTLGIL